MWLQTWSLSPLPGTMLTPASQQPPDSSQGQRWGQLCLRPLPNGSLCWEGESWDSRTWAGSIDLFCLNLARESLAHARKLPTLSCWRQIAKGTWEKHRSQKSSWFYKIWISQSQERKRGSWLGRIFTKLLSCLLHICSLVYAGSLQK